MFKCVDSAKMKLEKHMQYLELSVKDVTMWQRYFAGWKECDWLHKTEVFIL